MKRLIIALISAAFILAPMSASALEMMSDNSMKDVTGQAGVSIAIDDVVLYQYVEYTKYTDTDGIDETEYTIGDTNNTDDAASIKFSARESLMHINAITTGNDSDLTGPSITDGYFNGGYYNIPSGYAGDGAGGLAPAQFAAAPLSIDVGKCSVLSAGLQNNLGLQAVYADDAGTTPVFPGFTNSTGIADADATVTGVVIGLPTVEIQTTAESYTVGVETVTNATANAVNDGDNFIKIENGASTMAVLGGTLEIAPH